MWSSHVYLSQRTWQDPSREGTGYLLHVAKIWKASKCILCVLRWRFLAEVPSDTFWGQSRKMLPWHYMWQEVLLMPTFGDFKDGDHSGFGIQRLQMCFKDISWGCQSILVLEANLPPRGMSLQLIARDVMNSSLCPLSFRLRIHKSTCAVGSWDINHWDMKHMRFWKCMNLFGETGPPGRLNIHVYSTSIF